MTRRILFLALAALGGLLLYFGGSLPLVSHIDVLGIILLGIFLIIGMSPPPHISRRLESGPYFAGHPLTVTLTLTFPRWGLWPWVVVIDRLPDALAFGPARLVLYPRRRRQMTFTYTIRHLVRGQYVLGPIEIQWGDWFGWTRFTHRVLLETPLTVWPEITSWPTALTAYPLGEPRTPFGRPDPTPDFWRGLRPYVPGDRLSQIHWKSLARTDTWLTKEWDPPHHRWTFAVDNQKTFSPSEWELVLSVVASVMMWGHQTGYAVRVYFLDQREAFFDGTPTRQQLVQALNRLAEWPSDGVPASSSPPRFALGGAFSWWVGPSAGAPPPEAPGRWLRIGEGGLTRIADLPRMLQSAPRLLQRSGQ
ncbi:MAG: DUF58 domain-containing protein [Sulfobacillus sp.]|nr:DUF58 domain-containing protein [Sulfobacillus sp.]